MPWLDDTHTADMSAQKWQSILKNALQRRIQIEQLDKPLKGLHREYPASGRAVADVVFSLRTSESGFDDPLLFRYARLLLKCHYVGTGDLLTLLLRQSPFAKEHQDRTISSKTGLPTFEERMLTILTQMHVSGELVSSGRGLHAVVHTLTRWMSAVEEYETAKQLESAGMHTANHLVYGIYEALGSLVLTTFGHRDFRKIAKQTWWKQRRPTVVHAMELFDTNVLQWVQHPLAGRLRGLTTMPPFVATGDDGRPVFAAEQVLQAITDLPLNRSRAGLYIWLNASLCSRPLTDDVAMLSYLQARYSGDNQSLVVDLLIASFDILTNAMLRKESRQSVKVIRSFICNKVPLLLAMLAGYITPMTAEACTHIAFMAIPMNPVPPISAGSNDIQEILKRTRLEFLQACALHGLVTETAIGSIIEEPSIALPRVTRLTREGLVAQCTTNIGRLEGLVEDLESMQGNAGAVSGCIVDIVHNLCAAKDTMTVKAVCNMLIRRFPNMDMAMQHISPGALVSPLCSLLNNWTHDQDQVEFTPSYEEFAIILLFVLAVCHRFDLTIAEIGLTEDDCFMARLLNNIDRAIPLSELTEQQSGQLSRWIECLYSTDELGDTGGIGEEVMRQCPPQAFYLLVPTLFEQSVLACKSKNLTAKVFKGGLELLLEPLLLPSLVGGLRWLVRHSAEDHGDADILLQVLDKLIRTSSTSQETQAMHRAVLSMTAQPLTQSLRHFAKAKAERKEPHALLDQLKPHVDLHRWLSASRSQLEEAIATHGGQFEGYVRKTVADLTDWCVNIGPNPPPKFSYMMIEAGCNVLGAVRVLDSLIAELKTQASLGSPNDAIALDVCTAVICAPSRSADEHSLLAIAPPRAETREFGLKEALRLAIADTERLLRLPVSDADALVRLARRVEAQCATVQLPQIPLPIPQLRDEAADQMMADLGLTDGNITTGQSSIGTSDVVDLMQATDGMEIDFSTAMDQPVDVSGLAVQGVDMTSADDELFGGMMMELSADPQHANPQTGDGEVDVDEDIFAGLGDLGDDFTFT